MSAPTLSRPIRFQPAPGGAQHAYLGYQYLGLVAEQIGGWAAYRAPAQATDALDDTYATREDAAMALIRDMRLEPKGDK